MQKISNVNNKCGCYEPMLPRVSSDKRAAGDKLSEYIHWLIMCTDVNVASKIDYEKISQIYK